MDHSIPEKDSYIPSDEALKFIAFIRASGLEENANAEIHYRLADKYFGRDKNVLIESFRGSAKALALDEKVYTKNGIKTIAEINIGNKIYGQDGKLTRVTGKSEIFYDKPTYEVRFKDGRKITCSDDHLWTVKSHDDYETKTHVETLTTEDLYANQKTYKGNPRFSIPLAEAVEYPEKEELIIHPYHLGEALGTGSMKYAGHLDNWSGTIPKEYLYAPVEERRKLLRGLVDSCGTTHQYSVVLDVSNSLLYKSMLQLIYSLGLRVDIEENFDKNYMMFRYKLRVAYKDFDFSNDKELVNKSVVSKGAKHLGIEKVRRVRTVPTQCITVDNENKLFLTTNFIATHNSSLMEWLVIYIAALGKLPNFGDVGFIAFVGDSADNGVKNFFRNIRGKLDRSDFLKSVIDVRRSTDGEMELANKEGTELYIKGFGAASNIRGVRYKNLRPSMAIIDDITTNEAKTSEAIQKTIDDNFYKAIVPALHPTRYRNFVIGTPISEKDIIHQLSKNKSWVVHKFPICDQFPCTEEEFNGAWTDRFPYEAVLEKYESYLNAGKAQDFYQEFMLEITDLTTLLVEEDDIRWFDPEILLKNKEKYHFYISTDFATSTKKSADYSTIGVWAIGSDGSWFLVDGQCKRQGMQDNLKDLFRYVHKWRPLSVGIESSGQQGGFISILEDMMMQRNMWFQIACKRGSKEPGIRPLKDKVHRFVTGVQPMFKQNKIWLPKPELLSAKPYFGELLSELVHELSRFTLAGGVAALAHDDAIDLLNQLSEMELFTPDGSGGKEEFSVMDDDGDVWTSIWDHLDNQEENVNGNTIF
jgi:hypothetical protein